MTTTPPWRPAGERVIVNWMAIIAAGVFHRAADESRGAREANGFCDGVRIVAKTILKVGGDRQIGRVGNRAAVSEHLITRHGAILLARRKGKACASGGEGLETQSSQNAGAARIPWIWDDESARAGSFHRRSQSGGQLVQRPEFFCLVGLADVHTVAPAARRAAGAAR